jgi:hypothetical protein
VSPLRLWLDDARAAPEGWVHACTVAEAQALLASGEVEQASLDHDLGMDQPDGSALVRWMEQTGHWPKTRPVVHSMNPAGRATMEAVIERHFGDRQP